VLQCVMVCCGVLWCVAVCTFVEDVCCFTLQCVAVCYGVLQCVVVCCSVLWCVAVYTFVKDVCSSVLRCVEVCCGVLQCAPLSKTSGGRLTSGTSAFMMSGARERMTCEHDVGCQNTYRYVGCQNTFVRAVAFVRAVSSCRAPGMECLESGYVGCRSS